MAEASITPIYIGTQTITWASINNNAEGDITVTVPGAKVGRVVIVNFRSKFDAGVTIKQPAYCSAANTITITARNASGSSNAPSASADIILF